MKFNALSGQILKSKNYCPNPIVKYGIPAYADSILNPKVKDTLAYQQWWEEQLYYIKNGYTTGGIYIPGRYYKFLNFDRTQTVKGAGPLEIHDYQLDYALWIEDLKIRRKNAYIPKARRKAVSVMTVGMVMDYGWRFETNYHAAVVAGLDEYSQDFVDKWGYVNMNMVNEFRVRALRRNDDEIIAGWKEMSDDGWKDAGTMNTIYIRTVKHNPNVLKGKFLHDIILEESGENELLLETIKASEDCLKLGGTQFGTMFLYGTGGNMSKGSKGYKHIHHNLSVYNAEEWYVPAYVFYFPAYAGATDERGNVVEDIPNLQHLQPHERVGMSDFDRAKELIEGHSQKLLKEGDMDKYLEYRRNNPINIEEIFRITGSNNFDILKLNDQLYKIESGEIKYNRWRLDYKKDPKTGALLTPLQVTIEPASNKDPEHECVYILNDGHPLKGYRYLDVAGLDSYDQDQAKTSKSLGSMVVFRRQHSIPDMPGWLPVALIRNRPRYKEQFYELCLKLAIYYDLQEGVLVDVAKAMVIQYFKEAGHERLLSKRPRKFESPQSKQTHDYGVSLNNFSRPRMVGALQTFFDFHIEKVWFDVVLKEALVYDEFEIDSDNDSVDALGIALMKAIDCEQVPINDEEINAVNPYQYPEWENDEGGNIVDGSHNFEDKEPLGEKEDYFSRYARRRLNINNDMVEKENQDDTFDF